MVTKLKHVCTSIMLFMMSSNLCFAQSEGLIQIDVKNMRLRLEFYTPSIVRVVKVKDAETPDPSHFYIQAVPRSIKVKRSHKGDFLICQTDSLEIHVNKNTGIVAFIRDNKTLLEESEDVEFTPLQNKQGFYRVKQGYVLEKDESIYGLGQHQEGKLNQRNQQLLLQQTNKEVAIPIIQSLKGYGVIWNNETPTLFSDTLQKTYFLSDQGMAIDYFFISGKRTGNILAGIYHITGSAPMPPRWAFGYFQSKERYKNQNEVLDVVQRYRQLKVPLDCIIQDWKYWEEEGPVDQYWNGMNFSPTTFPRPKEMLDSVHLLNAHMIISVWPSFGPSTAPFKSFEKEGLLYSEKFTHWPKPGVRIYNAFSETGREIYWSYLNRNIFSKGMDGWWADATEPMEGDHSTSIPLLHSSMDTIAAIPNSFPLYTNAGVYENQRKTTGDKRVFILTRSAFTGQQRYGTFVWSGDIVSDWEVMKNQISGGINIGLSGIPYWNTDIGGFFSTGGFKGENRYRGGVADMAYRELYVRWIQFGTFCALMRSHGTGTPREIYNFGQEGDWAYDAIKKYINLRYQFLPYNYSTAYQVTKNSLGFIRPLFSDFASDKTTHDINDQFLYGSSLLIAPVTESQYIDVANGVNTTNFVHTKLRKLYLPAGCNWYDFWNNNVQKGGQWVEKETPVDIIPVYVKAGSILPLGKEKQFTSEDKDETLQLNIYDGANGIFTLYEDEGDNYNYEKGKYSTIDFRWNNNDKTLTIGKRNGGFSGMLLSRTFKLVLVTPGKAKGYIRTITYNGAEMKVKMK